MMCYRDTTFCSSEVAEHTCGREFTEQDAKEAEKWWGGKDYPVAYSEFCKEPELEKLIRNNIHTFADEYLELDECVAAITDWHSKHELQAKKNGFYMAAGLFGADISRVEELWDKCEKELEKL